MRGSCASRASIQEDTGVWKTRGEGEVETTLVEETSRDGL